ncbi:hypothetical protein A3746_16530 [Oleibacter sp. HI0075]|nr:hypothetical protein A3746_16530 [Oleibacter sp. HI0075]
MALNSDEWEMIVKKGENANINRSVFVRTDKNDSWKKLKAGHEGNYYMTTMLRALYALATLPEGNRRMMQQKIFGPCKMFYEILDNGDVQVDLFVVDEALEAPKHKAAGLYQAEWGVEERSWSLPDGGRPEVSMDLTHKWGKAHMAAVAGKFDSCRDAAKKLGTHIENAWFGNDEIDDYRKPNNHYSLFWMNNEFTSKDQLDHLISLIQMAQRSQESLRWLVHGEGAACFVKALNYLNKNPASSDIHVAQRGLEKQSVFFSNPRGKTTSKNDLEALCKKSGLVFQGININKRDVIHNPDARSEALGELKSVGAKLTLGGGLGAIGLSGAAKSLDLAVSAPSAAVAGGILLAGYVVVKDSYKKNSAYVRNIQGAFAASFGKGNEDWAA